MSGGLAQIFGRRPIVLGSLIFFAVGSAISATAQNMNMLIAGRSKSLRASVKNSAKPMSLPSALQGIGGGGILSLTEIIVADLVPLRLRGPFM